MSSVSSCRHDVATQRRPARACDRSPRWVRPRHPARGHPVRMTVGGSLFLIAVGAILYFAVTASVAGIDIQTVGLILMIVGVVGLALGLFFLSRRPGPGPGPPPPDGL